MKNSREKNVYLILVFLSTLLFSQCGQSISKEGQGTGTDKVSQENTDSLRLNKVTFIELGSVRCIPCQQMQPVMKSIETKYSREVNVVFHDVWTEAGKPFGVKYGIESIPTQVFLDQSGKEYYRHVGYFPEEELVKILSMKGVKEN